MNKLVSVSLLLSLALTCGAQVNVQRVNGSAVNLTTTGITTNTGDLKVSGNLYPLAVGPSKVVVTGAGSNFVASSVSLAELGHLIGLTVDADTLAGTNAPTLFNPVIAIGLAADGALNFNTTSGTSHFGSSLQVDGAVKFGAGAGNGKVFTSDASGNGTWQNLAGSGTVTSVGFTVPGVLFSVAGQPITGAGTIALSLLTQTANTIFAGPGSGGAVTPTFRAMVPLDVPNLDAAKITTGTLSAGLLPLGSSSAFGAVKVDNVTITASAGVISAVGGTGGGTNMVPVALTIATFTNVACVGTLPTGASGAIRYKLTLTTNCFIQKPTGTPVDQQVIIFTLIQDATGTHPIYFDTNSAGGFAQGIDLNFPIPNTTNALKRDFVGFTYDIDLNKWCLTSEMRGF